MSLMNARFSNRPRQQKVTKSGKCWTFCGKEELIRWTNLSIRSELLTRFMLPRLACVLLLNQTYRVLMVSVLTIKAKLLLQSGAHMISVTLLQIQPYSPCIDRQVRACSMCLVHRDRHDDLRHDETRPSGVVVYQSRAVVPFLACELTIPHRGDDPRGSNTFMARDRVEIACFPLASVSETRSEVTLHQNADINSKRENNCSFSLRFV